MGWGGVGVVVVVRGGAREEGRKAGKGMGRGQM